MLKSAMMNFPVGHVTKETFKTNHFFDCNSKSLIFIYLISCKVCSNRELKIDPCGAPKKTNQNI